MAWVVDTSVLIDVFENDPQFGLRSARCMTNHVSKGLLICPVSYAEFSPVCTGEESVAQDFLLKAGVNWLEPWTWRDTVRALWNERRQAAPWARTRRSSERRPKKGGAGE